MHPLPSDRNVPRTVGIVAIDRNGAIGKDGALPWHYSSDMRFFRQQTTGNACVMGRRTWESLGRPLKNRLNIVLTSSSEIAEQPSLLVLHQPESVLVLAPFLNCDLYVIGGAQIYTAFASAIDRWLVTRVPLTVDGADTLMPAHFLDGFAPVETQALEGDLKGDLEVTVYDRVPAGSIPSP